MDGKVPCFPYVKNIPSRTKFIYIHTALSECVTPTPRLDWGWLIIADLAASKASCYTEKTMHNRKCNHYKEEIINFEFHRSTCHIWCVICNCKALNKGIWQTYTDREKKNEEKMGEQRMCDWAFFWLTSDRADLQCISALQNPNRLAVITSGVENSLCLPCHFSFSLILRGKKIWEGPMLYAVPVSSAAFFICSCLCNRGFIWSHVTSRCRRRGGFCFVFWWENPTSVFSARKIRVKG